MFNQLWYNSLTKPPFNPPAEIFSPVWTVLYITILASFILYLRKPAQNKASGYVYFCAQLIFNILWTPLFFGLENILLALMDIILLDIFTILTIRKFYSVSKPAAIILLPYLLWILFATYLTFAYMVLNS